MVAFDALIECIAEGDFDTCQEVPAGNDDGFLVNPLGGLAVDMAGAAGYDCVLQHEVRSTCPFKLIMTTERLSPGWVS